MEISHPDEIYFPAAGITKREFVAYYEMMAPHMQPYTRRRPLVMQRFPEGITHQGFYHKNAPDYFPPWVTRINIPKQSGEPVHYVVGNTARILVYIANAGCITPHLWLSKIDKLDYPDQMVFDLDPSKKNDFHSVIYAARALKEVLESWELVPFVKSTGSRGLHVVVPLKRLLNFDAVRTCAAAIASELVEQHPKLLTLDVRKDKRRGRIFIDTLRNAFGATAVAPYAVRALPNAPVAVPLWWDELSNKRLTPTLYHIRNIQKRLDSVDDPWENFFASTCALKKLYASMVR